MSESRLALGSVYEDVTVIKNRLVFFAVINLDECREACAALADDTCLFDHFEVGSLFDLLESLRLLCVRLDDDAVLSDLDDFTGYAGVDISTKACRCSDKLSSLDLVADLYDRFTRSAYGTLLQ